MIDKIIISDIYIKAIQPYPWWTTDKLYPVKGIDKLSTTGTVWYRVKDDNDNELSLNSLYNKGEFEVIDLKECELGGRRGVREPIIAYEEHRHHYNMLMSNTNKVYVVTKYWDNGESYGYNYHYHNEKPVKVFKHLNNAKKYCEEKGGEIENATLYENQVAIYRIIKIKEYSECPIGKDFRNCDYEYDEDYCDECYGKNHDTFYDNSFEELRIYEVEMGD